MEARGRARGGFASMLDSHPKRIATLTAESIYPVPEQANQVYDLVSRQAAGGRREKSTAGRLA
jgi:hypothetical protein